MNLGDTVQQILSTIGNFLNNLLAEFINLFDRVFSFLPPNLRTGVEIVVVIIVLVIIYFLWRRD